MQPICPACCSDDFSFLGNLGRREHFTCRDCAAEWSRPIDIPDLPDPFEEDVCDGNDSQD